MFSNIKTILKTQIVRSAFALLLTTGLTSILGFLFWQILTRFSGFNASQVGEATTLVALASATSLIATSGLKPSILLQLSSREKELDVSKLTHGYALLSSFISVLLTAGLQLVLLLTSDNFGFLTDPILFMMTIILAATISYGFILDTVSVSLDKSANVPKRNTGQSVFKLGLIIPLVYLGMNAPTSALLATIIGGVAVNAFYAKKLAGKITPAIGDVRYSKSYIKTDALHHQISSLGAALPPVITPLIMTMLIGTKESAIFSIAWMIGALFFTISPAVANAFVSASANKDAVILNSQIKKASYITLVLMLMPMVFVILLPELILGLFGEEYKAGTIVLILLAFSAIPDAYTNILAAYLRVQGNLAPVSWLNGFMGLLTIILIFATTPFLGYSSPGWSWLIAQTLGSIMISIYLLSRYLKTAKETK